MFDLDLEVIVELDDIPPRGGGMSSTEEEIILVTGDGRVRVVDAASGDVSEPTIELPPINYEAAVEASRAYGERVPRSKALKNARRSHRYNDVLVFDDGVERWLALTYNHFDPDRACFSLRVSAVRVPLASRLAELDLSAAAWEDGTKFISSPCLGFRRGVPAYAALQSGGRMAVLDAAASRIAVTVGDFRFEGIVDPNHPQDEAVDYGKLFALDLRRGTKERISLGHRNPQGVIRDSQGRIWSVEHGPRGGDELNLIVPGGNYGWPNVTLGLPYSDMTWPHQAEQGRHDGYRAPVFAWVPSIGISNLDESVGFHPFWENDLLVFSMKQRAIERVRLDGDHVQLVERIRFHERIRYGLNHAASRSLFLWTDAQVLHRATPGKRALELIDEAVETHARFTQQGVVLPVSPAAATLQRCLECHAGSNAPPLEGVFRRRIAKTSFDGYSESLRQKGGVWNEEKLRAYLADPARFAPGGTMKVDPIESEAEIDALIWALKQISPDVHIRRR
jgi:cytochrome c2